KTRLSPAAGGLAGGQDFRIGRAVPRHVSAFARRPSANTAIESRNSDAAVGVVKGRNHLGQRLQRIVNGPAEIARVEIGLGTADFEFQIQRPAYSVVDRRAPDAEHWGIRHHRYVSGQQLAVLDDERK